MEELNQIECPLCKEAFKDKRGLTSHARSKHGLNKDKVSELICEKEKQNKTLGFIGCISLILLSIISFGRVN